MGKSYAVAEARNRFSEILLAATATHEPVLIRRRGKPVAVIIGIDEYEALAEHLEELEDIRDAEASLKEHERQGRSIRDLFAEIEGG